MPDLFGDTKMPLILPSREILRGPVRSFRILSRLEAERGPGAEEPYLLISIGDPYQERCPHASEWKSAARYLDFHDIRGGAAGLQPFTPRHAKVIVNLLLDNPHVPLVVVHCEAGISRSAAVAAELSRWQNGAAHDEAWFVRHFAPNPWVRQVLREYIERRVKGGANAPCRVSSAADFEVLAAAARLDHAAGRTRDLREYATEKGAGE
jgi:predicted protein tyrosine phosphatase